MKRYDASPGTTVREIPGVNFASIRKATRSTVRDPLRFTLACTTVRDQRTHRFSIVLIISRMIRERNSFEIFSENERDILYFKYCQNNMYTFRDEIYY